MYLRLLKLEILNFFRNPQLGANLALKVLSYFGIIYFSLMFAGLAFVLYYWSVEEMHVDPLKLFSKYFFYYWMADLVLRFLMQSMPTQNIKPLLTIGLSKNFLVKYSILKVFMHYFNWIGLVFLIPFACILIFSGGYPVFPVFAFVIGITLMFYFNNFFNILLNGKDSVFYTMAAILVALVGLDYFNLLNVTDLSEKIFYSFYEHPLTVLLPFVMVLGLAVVSHRMIYTSFYLDKGLELKKMEGKTENIEFLNRYGTIGVFLNNDIRMIKRSKAARAAAGISVLFLFYGLLSLMNGYERPFMKLFTALFVSGGFMFMFGQRVPSWDSSYYPLMMTQRVPYRQFLMAKWVLVVIATFISMILAVIYVFVLGWEFYLTVIAAGLYNIGVNSFMTLVAGAFNKTPIDLNTARKSMNSGQNKFNMRVILMIVPQLLLPMIAFSITKYFFGIYAAVAVLGGLGLIGLLLRNKFFDYITKVYKTEKYSTLEAFKKNS